MWGTNRPGYRRGNVALEENGRGMTGRSETSSPMVYVAGLLASEEPVRSALNVNVNNASCSTLMPPQTNDLGQRTFEIGPIGRVAVCGKYVLDR